MSRYIDLDEYIKKLNSDEIVEKMANNPFLYEQGYLSGLIRASITAKQIPTADVVEVRHGEWGDMKHNKKESNYYRVCSLCKWEYPVVTVGQHLKKYTYCPNCGAKMDGERREDGT